MIKKDKIKEGFLNISTVVAYLCILFLFPFLGISQVGINTPFDGSGQPILNESTILDINSSSKGFLPPRLTESQMNSIASPANGLMVYCTNCCIDGTGSPYYYDGDWKALDSECEIQIAPLCVEIDITVENSNHMNTGNSEVLLINGITDGNQGGPYRMHNSSQDQVRVEFPSFEIPAGYSVELFFEYPNNGRTIGIEADFINNGSTYRTIDTRGLIPTLPPGATIVASGGGTYTLTYLLPQPTDELFITAIGGQHPWLYEIKVLDQLGVPINMQLSCP